MVKLGLAMADVVRSTAAEKDLDVGVRIGAPHVLEPATPCNNPGVHTGTVIGGIIGTVRFHFDMCRSMLKSPPW